MILTTEFKSTTSEIDHKNIWNQRVGFAIVNFEKILVRSQENSYAKCRPYTGFSENTDFISSLAIYKNTDLTIYLQAKIPILAICFKLRNTKPSHFSF